MLVTLKWSFWEVFEISMFETQNHFSSCCWLHKIEFRVWGRYVHDFSKYFYAHLNLRQILSLTKIWTSLKHENEKGKPGSLFRVRGRYMIFLVWICLDFVYQLECLLYGIYKKLGYVLWFFIFFLNFSAHLNLGQILGTYGLTNIWTCLKHENKR